MGYVQRLCLLVALGCLASAIYVGMSAHHRGPAYVEKNRAHVVAPSTGALPSETELSQPAAGGESSSRGVVPPPSADGWQTASAQPDQTYARTSAGRTVHPHPAAAPPEDQGADRDDALKSQSPPESGVDAADGTPYTAPSIWVRQKMHIGLHGRASSPRMVPGEPRSRG